MFYSFPFRGEGWDGGLLTVATPLAPTPALPQWGREQANA